MGEYHLFWLQTLKYLFEYGFYETCCLNIYNILFYISVEFSLFLWKQTVKHISVEGTTKLATCIGSLSKHKLIRITHQHFFFFNNFFGYVYPFYQSFMASSRCVFIMRLITYKKLHIAKTGCFNIIIWKIFQMLPFFRITTNCTVFTFQYSFHQFAFLNKNLPFQNFNSTKQMCGIKFLISSTSHAT